MIPGYSGHIPRLQETVGYSYGQATRALSPQKEVPVTRSEPRRSVSVEGRIPGYRGYVPRMINSFERTFGAATREALTEQKLAEGPPATRQPQPPREKYFERGTPILPHDLPESHRPSTSTTTRSSRSFNAFEQGTRPIPGYSGFIPRMRETRLGCTFAGAVDAALRPETAPAPTTSTQPSQRTLERRGSDIQSMLPDPTRVPGYRGYIPVRFVPVCLSDIANRVRVVV